MFTALFALGVWLAGPAVLHLLYDGQYDGYAGVLWIVALLPFAAAVSNLTQALLRAQERPEAVFAARAGAAGVTATLGAAAVFAFGVAGALVSDLLASVVDAATMAGFIRRGPKPIVLSGSHDAAQGDGAARRHVLVAAFACGPGRGSEPGLGWQVATRLAAHHDVTVVTYSGWRDRIEAELADRPVPGLRVAYYRLPLEPARHHAGGEEWTGFAEQFHYIAWTLGARGLVRRLHDATPFDAAVHTTFARYWSPSPAAALVGVPFVWGPVGGGEIRAPGIHRAVAVAEPPARAPARDRPGREPRAPGRPHDGPPGDGRARDDARDGGPDGAPRRARRRGRARGVALVQDEARPPRRAPAAAARPADVPLHGPPRRLEGRGHRPARLRQSVRRCIRTPSPGARFVVVGDGPERARLEALAVQLGARIEFRGAVPRDVALATLAEAHVQVHPSLHDSGGYATLEALAAGRPVVCLALGGPAEQVVPDVGVAVPAVTPEQAVTDMAAAFVRLARDPDLRARMGRAARARVADRYIWERVLADLAARLDGLLGAAPPADPLPTAQGAVAFVARPAEDRAPSPASVPSP